MNKSAASRTFSMNQGLSFTGPIRNKQNQFNKLYSTIFFRFPDEFSRAEFLSRLVLPTNLLNQNLLAKVVYRSKSLPDT